MPDHKKMEATIHAYVDAFAKGSADAVAELFAEDCIVEDPVGTPPHKGLAAAKAFYAESMKTGAKLTLEGPIRLAQDYAVFPFSVKVDLGGTMHQIDVIDVMRFNEDNKIIEMRAFFGESNVKPL